MIKKITDYLEEVGLTEVEATLYQGLLETGPTTVMALAQHTGIKRITTHFNVENLIKRGLVTQTIQGARRQIVAEPPERLEYLVEKKVEDAKNLENKFPDILHTIGSYVREKESDEKITIKYYDDKKGVQSIYHDMLKADKVHSFINLDKYYEVFPGTENIFWDALNANSNREVWDIAVVESPLAKKISKGHKRYYCKFISDTKSFLGFDILIYDDKVSIIVLEKNNTLGLIISSTILFLSLRSLHQTMWELLPNIKRNFKL